MTVKQSEKLKWKDLETKLAKQADTQTVRQAIVTWGNTAISELHQAEKTEPSKHFTLMDIAKLSTSSSLKTQFEMMESGLYQSGTDHQAFDQQELRNALKELRAQFYQQDRSLKSKNESLKPLYPS